MASRLKVTIIALALVALAGLAIWWTNARADRAEQKLGLDAARTLSETFARSRDLRVATLSGDVIARADDPGFANLLPSGLTMRYPYRVDYFLDLRRVDASAYRWDAATKTLTVLLPDVSPARPNIDAARARTIGTTGLFMTRDAAQRLNRQVVARAATRASASADKPEHRDAARVSAREAMRALAAAPLRAAGMGDIKVVARFPWEGSGSGVPVRWDESRTIHDVYEANP